MKRNKDASSTSENPTNKPPEKYSEDMAKRAKIPLSFLYAGFVEHPIPPLTTEDKDIQKLELEKDMKFSKQRLNAIASKFTSVCEALNAKKHLSVEILKNLQILKGLVDDSDLYPAILFLLNENIHSRKRIENSLQRFLNLYRTDPEIEYIINTFINKAHSEVIENIYTNYLATHPQLKPNQKILMKKLEDKLILGSTIEPPHKVRKIYK